MHKIIITYIYIKHRQYSPRKYNILDSERSDKCIDLQ